MTPEQFAAHPRVAAAVLSPDGAWIAAAVQRQDTDGGRYVSDLWRVPTDGSKPTPLTDGDTNDRAPAFRSDGALGYLSDAQPDGEADNKHSQVWVLSARESVRLTDEPLGVSRFAFDGHTLVMIAPVLPGHPRSEQRAYEADRKKNGPSLLRYTKMPVRHWDHWRKPTRAHLMVLDAAGCRDLAPEVDGEFHESQWDVGAGKVVITAAEEGADRLDNTALWIFDLATGARTVLPARPRVNLESPRLSPDGTTIAVARSARIPGAHGPVRLCLYTADGTETVLAADWDRWPTPVAWRGSEVIAEVRHEGTTSLFAIDASGQHRPLSLGHSHGGISVTGGVIVGLQHHLLSPPAPFLLPASGPLRLLPLHEPPALDVVVENHTITSTDGVTVQGYIVRPREITGPLPALLWVHGGPVSHWADWWHWRWNAAIFADAGYVIALPNPRGSTGFGQEFVEGIWNNAWGGQCVADVLAFADALSARPDVDSSRVGAMGASFGGYMMNWLGGTTDRFACIICHAGIFDFRAFYGVTDYPAYWGHQFGCDPYSDPAGHHHYSPIRNLPDWTSPTLIIHGEKDYRCPIDQALGLFEGLQRHGVPSELVVFPDEGHWIMKPRNVVAWHETCLEYLDRVLRA
ncbi:MAG: dipeptidyl aminopeptidase/acylaminoacyl peptidase [Myxococcota bacterium]|jgi:dipeptidyl aminopeptidase/acylaminoacyl peptidase